MERRTEHHLIFTRRQIQALGGAALDLRNSRQMRIMLIGSVHNELHANIDAVNFLPQEHARSIFRGVQDLGLEYMPTMRAVDALASHMGKVSLRKSMSLQSQRIAMRLEENLINQRPYLISGMIL
jgi:hypothetical protein